jgi:hypothetical protein
MVDQEKALVIVDVEAVSIGAYDNDLVAAGLAADHASKEDTLKLYHASLSENTVIAQHQALQLFSDFLKAAGVTRQVSGLYQDAQAWRGMSEGLAKGFRTWLVNAGYRIGSINHRLAVIRQYCRLAHDAGVIPDETYDLILTVKGFSARAGINIDRDREREGTPTTISS